MEKVIVIGCPGSGKSMFSEKLSNLTNLPLYHLDMIYHKSDKTHISKKEFDEKLSIILKKDSWIIDGNYQRTMEMRMSHCDTVFLLDLSTDDCINGAESRVGKKRKDMPWIEKQLDEKFKQVIIDFPKNKLPKIYELLKKFEKNVEIHIFKSRKEIDAYLEFYCKKEKI